MAYSDNMNNFGAMQPEMSQSEMVGYPKARVLGIRSVMQNAAVVTVSSCINNFILGVTGIYIVRYLGLSLYSDYSTAMLYMAMFGVLGKLGFNQVCLRECSRDQSKTPWYYGAAFFLDVSLITLGYIAALVIAFFRYDSQIFILTTILGLSLVLMSLSKIPLIVFQSHQKMHIPAIISFGSILFYATSFFVAIYMKASVYTFAVLHLSMNLILLTLKCIFSFKIAFPRLSRGFVLEVARIGKVFCVITIMTVLYSQSNGFLLAFFNKGDEVGIYNAAFKVYGLFQMIALTVNSAISPAIYGANKSTERVTRGVKLAMRYFVTGGILVGVVMIGRANWFMVTLFKEEFQESATVLKFLGIAITFRLLIFLLSHVIYGQDKERYMATLLTILGPVTFVLGLLLIPRYGAVAAASLFLTAEATMAILSLIKTEQMLGRPGFWKLLIPPAFVGVLILGMLINFKHFPITGILLSPVLFFGLLFAFGYYKIREVLTLFKLLVTFRSEKAGGNV